MKLFFSVLLVISICSIFLAGCGGAAACPKIGDAAPNFTLPTYEGKNISLSDYAGKPVIINTWSVSCIECKKEMPYLKQICDEYVPQGLVFLSVNTLDSTSVAKDFLSQNGYNFTVLFDSKRTIYKTFCLPKEADPNTFFIGKDGIIKSIKIGGFASKDDVETEVQKIMGGS
ncbi:MAG: TlpA disulfide reductase family protein [Dehalococcoidia bacterium]|jgi:peroxiredoxin